MGKGYICATNTMDNLKTIASDYEKAKGLKLGSKPSYRPTSIGGTDIEIRTEQIRFIEGMLTVLTEKLPTPPDAATTKISPEELNAIRCMIAACLFVDSKLSSGALKKILNKILNLHQNTPMNLEDKVYCLMSAKEFLKINNVHAQIVDKLNELGKEPIPLLQWNEFINFVDDELKAATIAPEPHYLPPCASFGSYIFGQIGEYAGFSAGRLAGHVLSKTVQVMPAKYSVAMGLTAVIVTVEASNPITASIAASLAANYMVETFLQISMAHIGATAGKAMGNMAGTLAGGTFDVGKYIVKTLYESLISLYRGKDFSLPLTGINIRTGKVCLNGEEIHEVPVLEEIKPENVTEIHITLRDNMDPVIKIKDNTEPKVTRHADALEIQEDYEGTEGNTVNSGVNFV